MTQHERPPSARRDELLERAYRYALEHGLAELSLRPLAAAIGSSPRVLLFLFGSKDELIRALLARARADELAALRQAREATGADDFAAAVRATWAWLVAPAHRPMLVLWLQAYARSLSEPDGPWAGFARQTVADWLGLLADAHGEAGGGATDPALGLALLRGALLDLLATGDAERTTAVVERYLCLVGTTAR
ncbi:TetR/AcrR family transcriptional regulator [Micromonospora sp. DR5-3]|uniref:TetR/AcrR family transcriptional regulator n=1 Tax=unclassified Micromonospora TaxID=2617518 RepID=UPI00210852A8|nr:MULTISPECIES: TetR/AcrR family transcriptional regulator [unclassified Micromonospora]MCW3814839.1 TetR/AcrR family transcriptional regulator [Micromonospora sp. DR5-3]